MSGGFAPVKGATGPAPTTAWFGAAIPDRGFTLAGCGHYTIPAQGGGPANVPYFTDTRHACDLISRYIPFNTVWNPGGANAVTMALGAAVAAPDGTMNANLITETNTNTVHFMTAVYPDGSTVLYKRIAVIAQATATRTRMTVQLSLDLQVSTSGCRTVFDLAGVQIGVANTAFGGDPNWVAKGASIKALTSGPNPWCLCIMDAQCGTNVNGRWCSIGIGPEPGSGTAAGTFVFAGDPTKGINVWKTNLLPPRAWNIQNTTFFDDFTSMSTIDVNNTLQPGFNWYINWASFPWNTGLTQVPPPPWGSIPPGIMSIVGSTLQMNFQGIPNPDRHGASIASCGYISGGLPPPTGQPATPFISVDGPSVFKVGTGILMEASFAFTIDLANQSSRGVFFNSFDVNNLFQSNLNLYTAPPPGVIGPTIHEIDCPEIATINSGSGILSVFGEMITPAFSGLGTIEHAVGSTPEYILWSSQESYAVSGFNTPAAWNGQLWTPNTTVAVNEPPPDSNPHWSVFTPPANHPITANQQMTNLNNQNVFSTLWLPDYSMYDPHDVGSYHMFFNGILTYQPTTSQAAQIYYAVSKNLPLPNPSGATVLDTSFTVTEAHKQMFTVGGDWPNTVWYDFVRLSQ